MNIFTSYRFKTLYVFLFSLSCFSSVSVQGQNASLRNSESNSPSKLIRDMEGTWDVQQRMWPAANAEVINLPSATARRRMLGGRAFLEEFMELKPESKDQPFTRIAYFNYNTVNQQYEYFSIDSRAPQMMNEKSHDAGGMTKSDGQSVISLYGDSFVAPRWGNTVNATFRYRLTISGIENNRQIVRLYLTPQSAEGGKEFLAFEYVYTRRN